MTTLKFGVFWNWTGSISRNLVIYVIVSLNFICVAFFVIHSWPDVSLNFICDPMFPGTCSSPMRWLPWGEAGSGRGCRYPKHGITTMVWKRMLAMYTQSSGDTCPSHCIGLAEWGRTSKHLERILCVWRILSKVEEYIPSWESIVQARRVLSVFGGYCPSWRNIFQARRALSKLGEHCLFLEDIFQAGGIYSKQGEHCPS